MHRLAPDLHHARGSLSYRFEGTWPRRSPTLLNTWVATGDSNFKIPCRVDVRDPHKIFHPPRSYGSHRTRCVGEGTRNIRARWLVFAKPGVFGEAGVMGYRGSQSSYLVLWGFVYLPPGGSGEETAYDASLCWEHTATPLTKTSLQSRQRMPGTRRRNTVSKGDRVGCVESRISRYEQHGDITQKNGPHRAPSAGLPRPFPRNRANRLLWLQPTHLSRLLRHPQR